MKDYYSENEQVKQQQMASTLNFHQPLAQLPPTASNILETDRRETDPEGASGKSFSRTGSMLGLRKNSVVLDKKDFLGQLASSDPQNWDLEARMGVKE